MEIRLLTVILQIISAHSSPRIIIAKKGKRQSRYFLVHSSGVAEEIKNLHGGPKAREKGDAVFGQRATMSATSRTDYSGENVRKIRLHDVSIPRQGRPGSSLRKIFKGLLTIHTGGTISEQKVMELADEKVGYITTPSLRHSGRGRSPSIIQNLRHKPRTCLSRRAKYDRP